MKTPKFLAAALAGALALITSTVAHAADKKPNIVFILTDNLGYGEIGCYGGGITRGAPTPRIDSLAKEGMRWRFLQSSTFTLTRAKRNWP